MCVHVLMLWSQLQFDLDSTAVRLLTKGHQGHSDVTRAADPLYSHADLFIYLGLSAAAAAQW